MKNHKSRSTKERQLCDTRPYGEFTPRRRPSWSACASSCGTSSASSPSSCCGAWTSCGAWPTSSSGGPSCGKRDDDVSSVPWCLFNPRSSVKGGNETREENEQIDVNEINARGSTYAFIAPNYCTETGHNFNDPEKNGKLQNQNMQNNETEDPSRGRVVRKIYGSNRLNTKLGTNIANVSCFVRTDQKTSVGIEK